MLRQYKCEFCDFVIDKWFKHGRKSPKEPLKCKNCLKKGLRQVYTTNWFPPAEPTTFGKQSEVNCKRLGKEKVQLMYEDEPFTKQRKAQAKNIPWFRSGKVPGTERMEKALDVSKIKDTRKYIETGEKD